MNEEIDDDLSGLEIESVVDEAEALGKNSRYKPYLDNILKGLQENKGKSLKLKKTSPDKEALEKQAHSLRTQARKLGGEYSKIGFTINKDGNLFRLYAVWVDKAEKAGKTKGQTKGKTKGAKKKAHASSSTGQAAGAPQTWNDEMQNNLIQTINSGSMDAAAMSNLLSQQQNGIPELQQKLNDPATKEEDKAYINKQIQWAQEVIETINKKLGR